MFCLKGWLLPCLKPSLASIAYSGHFYTFKFLVVQEFGFLEINRELPDLYFA